jgi:tetratricopeptide (TPR) repeat protein
MADQWTSRLSDYLDDELEPAERAQVTAHLETCSECATVLQELQSVVARAQTLPSAPPRANLWPAIEARLARRSPFARIGDWASQRVSFTVPQLAAAALALMVLSGGLVWVSQYGGRTTSLPPVDAHGVLPAAFANPQYDEAIADLERTLDAGRSQLDPQTIRTIETNLASIDQAIEQSRRALAADPANAYLNSHLAEFQQRKLALLRRASALVGPRS